MNQWDPSFGRRIICKKPSEERDPAAREKRMGTRSTCHRRLSQRLPTISVHPSERNANLCGHPKMLRATHYAGSIAIDPEVMFQ